MVPNNIEHVLDPHVEISIGNGKVTRPAPFFSEFEDKGVVFLKSWRGTFSICGGATTSEPLAAVLGPIEFWLRFPAKSRILC